MSVLDKYLSNKFNVYQYHVLKFITYDAILTIATTIMSSELFNKSLYYLIITPTLNVSREKVKAMIAQDRADKAARVSYS